MDQMTDRELLELAAKAAGYSVSFDDSMSMQCVDGAYFMHDRGHPDSNRHGSSWWNPFADDGDALRLACDLGLRVYPVARTLSGAACSAASSVTNERLSEVCDVSLDIHAATRLAIVRAAAEIGRSMQ